MPSLSAAATGHPSPTPSPPPSPPPAPTILDLIEAVSEGLMGVCDVMRACGRVMAKIVSGPGSNKNKLNTWGVTPFGPTFLFPVKCLHFAVNLPYCQNFILCIAAWLTTQFA